MKARRLAIGLAAAIIASSGALSAQPTPDPCDGTCKPFQPDPSVCTPELLDTVRHPTRSIEAIGLGGYEEKVGDWMAGFCYRASQAGWARDARIRNTGPLLQILAQGSFSAHSVSTHSAVAIWYSPEMADWVRVNRPAEESQAPPNPPPVPEGSILVKEMWSEPAGQYADDCIDCMTPFAGEGLGVAYMIRDAQGLSSEWFFGYYSLTTLPDFPAKPNNSVSMTAGEGGPQFCYNCHASAVNNNTFSAARNLEPQIPEPSFAIQTLEMLPSHVSGGGRHDILVNSAPDVVDRLGTPFTRYDPDWVKAIPAGNFPAPDWQGVDYLPSQTYDSVFVPGKPPLGPGPDEYLSSTQCIGCHSAYATGLQYYMTAENPYKDGQYDDDLIDESPYMLWRSSPMGMSGRDPIFFAQLETERVLHGAMAKDGGEKPNATPKQRELGRTIQDLCLQCHGIMGERQFQIDTRAQGGNCEDFPRADIDAVPFPHGNPTASRAKYGSLARDGIACTTCHRMVLGPSGVDLGDNPNEQLDPNQNFCVVEKQQEVNPGFRNFATTFTGNFLVGPPSEAYGPYMDPKKDPMRNSLAIDPEGGKSIAASELCGTCHTVHLPTYDDQGNLIKRIYEQTTYAEWIFSDYRTQTTIAGNTIPAGTRNQSCQFCHVPDQDAEGHSFSSRIADIEESTLSPNTDYRLGPEKIDLPVRTPYSRHILVGLNVFFVKMLKQFPDVLGIATKIGLSSYSNPTAVPPLVVTEQAMLDQAQNRTVKVAVKDVAWNQADRKVQATVDIESLVGHSFPSGVGFRRAFIEFSVLDREGRTLWASGRTNEAGVLVDENGAPVRGEFWWPDDCSTKFTVEQAGFQPHFSMRDPVTRQDQVQIYQELELAPDGKFTTSFLSIDHGLKDNRILPHGFLPLEAPPGQLSRRSIATTLGDTTPFLDPETHPRASVNLAYAVQPEGRAAEDPEYQTGGGDKLAYEAQLQPGQMPASVQAKIYYQAIPPFYLQDRFCIAQGKDTQRLYFLAGHLNLEESEAENWRLLVVESEQVPIP